jgi:hypothetical protein
MERDFSIRKDEQGFPDQRRSPNSAGPSGFRQAPPYRASSGPSSSAKGADGHSAVLSGDSNDPANVVRLNPQRLLTEQLRTLVGAGP